MMKRTVLASALSFAVAFGAVAPAFAQDMTIDASGNVSVSNPIAPGADFTVQLPSGDVVTLQAGAEGIAAGTVAPPPVTPIAAAGGGTAAGAGATGGGVAAGGAAGAGLGGGFGLIAVGALAAVGIIASVIAAGDTN